MKTVDEVFREMPTPSFCVASVHHTGTWFVLNFLLSHPGTWELVELRTAVEGREVKPSDVLHFHLYGDGVVSRGPFHETGLLDAAVRLSRKVPTVVPVRDPLLSLISRQARHPELDHVQVVRAFEYLDRFSNSAVFVPVDLLNRSGIEARREKLEEVLGRLGLEWEEWCDDYAREWPVANTVGGRGAGLREMYERRDVESLRGFLRAEMEELDRIAPTLIPFLQTLGYSDLPWWR